MTYLVYRFETYQFETGIWEIIDAGMRNFEFDVGAGGVVQAGMRVGRLGVLVGLTVGAWAQAGEQRAWMVFGRGCLKEIKVGQETELRFPMVNGEPDWGHGVLRNADVVYDPKCGRIEIERVK